MLSCVLGLLAVFGLTKYELLDYDPVADSNAVVFSSDHKARFTVLTPSLIRMEYSAGGTFEDRPTLAFVNRKLTVPKFTYKESNAVLTINTSVVSLQYLLGSPFNATSLFATGLDGGAFKYWNGGLRSSADPGNLFGTYRTLDGQNNNNLNCTISDLEHCEFGIISRSGWALVDDSVTPVLDDDDWWTDNNGNLYTRKSDIDWYLFTHGHNYRQALLEYTWVGGRIPLTPRYISGIWFTRWYNYNSLDTRKVIEDYESRQIPLDVWVYDMNWHMKHDWTGYTLDPSLFPYPDDIFEYLAYKGLKVAGNLHDASGVHNWETQFPAMASALGYDPTKITSLSLSFANKSYIYALEDIVLQPLEKLGFSFWWIDWQQGESGYGTKGGKMNPTIWTDKMRVTNPKRRSVMSGKKSSDPVDRGVVFARFGGLGNHRYQVGFSGDVAELSWQDLAYQPYFSARSSNVLYGFWSHDIEGPGDDPEMYVRWIQWGAFSGVMRSHDRGMSSGGCYGFPTVEGSCPVVEPWNVARKYFEANRDALQQRAALIPYIYTQTRIAFETGVSIIRPLFYDYPEDDMAYAGDENGNFVEYLFGNDMLIAPVVSPSDSTTMTSVTFYLPQGIWVERHSGTVFDLSSGGKTFTKQYDLTEIPVFVRGGAVIAEKPTVTTTGAAMQQYTSLIFSVFPGASQGSTAVYEDDAATTAYLSGEYAWTHFNYTRNGQTLTCKISTVVNAPFDALPSTREIVVKIINAQIATSVSVNGKQLNYARYASKPSWSYDGNQVTLVVNAGVFSTSDTVVISITTLASNVDLSGIRGVIRHAVLAKRNLDETRSTPGSNTGDSVAELSNLAIQGDVLSYLAKDANAFSTAVGNLTNHIQATIAELSNLVPPPSDALVQLYDSGRRDNCLCGSDDCRDSNSGYSFLRIEGYMPAAAHPGAVPLYMYWNNIQDNYATTDPNIPKGYVKAVFDNGFVLSIQEGQLESGVSPVAVYRLNKTGDYLTVSSPNGVAYAQQNNYTLINGTIGYAYTSPPLCALGNVNAARLNYSIALMNSALQSLHSFNFHSVRTSIPYVASFVPKPEPFKWVPHPRQHKHKRVSPETNGWREVAAVKSLTPPQ